MLLRAANPAVGTMGLLGLHSGVSIAAPDTSRRIRKVEESFRKPHSAPGDSCPGCSMSPVVDKGSQTDGRVSTILN